MNPDLHLPEGCERCKLVLTKKELAADPLGYLRVGVEIESFFGPCKREAPLERAVPRSVMKMAAS